MFVSLTNPRIKITWSNGQHAFPFLQETSVPYWGPYYMGILLLGVYFRGPLFVETHIIGKHFPSALLHLEVLLVRRGSTKSAWWVGCG